MIDWLIDWLIDRCYTFVLSTVLVFHPFNGREGNKNFTIGNHCYYKYQYFNNKPTKNINDENERNIISGDSWISREVIYMHTQTIYLPTQTDFLVLIYHTPEKKVKMSLRKKTCSLSSEGKKVFKKYSRILTFTCTGNVCKMSPDCVV